MGISPVCGDGRPGVGGTARLLFWDDFSKHGELGPEEAKPSAVGAVCLKREIAAGAESEYVFLLRVAFSQSNTKRCGWDAPKGHEQTVIGNWYTKRFSDAWSVAEYAASNLETLEKRTERFVAAVRDTTLPGAIKDAAMANLSTLVEHDCFGRQTASFTRLKDQTMKWAAVLVTALTCGIMKPPPRTCFLRFPVAAAERIRLLHG